MSLNTDSTKDMRLFLLIAAFISSFLSFGQITGEVYYTTTINLHKGLPNDDHGQRMKEYIPETMVVNNVLYLDSTESLYKVVEDTVEEVNFDDMENRRMMFLKKRFAPANDAIYTNMSTGEIVEKKEFMDKIFLIKDTIRSTNWKFSGETMDVGGYSCMRADYIPPAGDTTQISVWFTPEMISASGPAGYGGLPGLILYVNVNDGQMTISLDRLVIKKIAEGIIEKPKKGKVVTMEEFEEIKQKKMEEQRKNWQGHGHGGGRRG